MVISKESFAVSNINYNDYLTWCKRMKLNKNETSSKKRFFADIRSGKIIKDFKNNKIIIKRNEGNIYEEKI